MTTKINPPKNGTSSNNKGKNSGTSKPPRPNPIIRKG
jgi:hypothetical protein